MPMKSGDSKHRVALALRRYVQGKAPSRGYVDIFGCDADFLREFIEHQFTGGMNWKNFGRKWKIGHLLAPSYFRDRRRADVRLCWNWINMRPVAEGKSRLAMSPGAALAALKRRRRFFRENSVIGDLVAAATAAVEREVSDDADWSKFYVER